MIHCKVVVLYIFALCRGNAQKYLNPVFNDLEESESAKNDDKTATDHDYGGTDEKETLKEEFGVDL